MKIALINGSPKVKESASKSLLEELRAPLAQQAEITELAFHTAAVSDDALAKLRESDVWIFACPLYVDGIPAHLLSCLIALENAITDTARIYAIVNCGFYEGNQAAYALDIFQNWCLKAGLTWGGGIGVGGGGGLAQMPKTASGQGPWAPICNAFTALAEEILQSKETKNKYVSVAFPRPLYKMAAQLGWRQQIRANGGKARDLKNRPS